MLTQFLLPSGLHHGFCAASVRAVRIAPHIAIIAALRAGSALAATVYDQGVAVHIFHVWRRIPLGWAPLASLRSVVELVREHITVGQCAGGGRYHAPPQWK